MPETVDGSGSQKTCSSETAITALGLDAGLRGLPIPAHRSRLALPGIPWHIIQRGNNRAVCFHGEDDYQFYLHYLNKFSGKFGCPIHAYVLMTNHVHLLFTPEKRRRQS